jgi:hypothetical protein
MFGSKFSDAGPDARPEGAAPAPAVSIRADMGRLLADSLARALGAGDTHAARVALIALSGLVDDASDAAVPDAAPLIDLPAAADRLRREQ